MVASLVLAAAISITVLPHVCFAPCEIRITVRVPKDSANRMLRLQVGEEHLTERQLEGDKSPITWTFYRVIHEMGQWEVIATLFSIGNSPKVATTQVTVGGPTKASRP